MSAILCFFGIHNWKIILSGPSHKMMIQFHSLADTQHRCVRCDKKRDWLHTPIEELRDLERKGIMKLVKADSLLENKS